MSPSTVSLGFSSCPNDCFMFDAIVNRRIDLEGLEFTVRMADVEALNKAAFAGEIDVTKLSFHAYAYCARGYVLLDAGSALGRNCGPLLISKRPIARDEVAAGRLRIAIPGRYTTANFLLGLAFPDAKEKTELVFSAIEPALLEGRFDAGLIIHENRFTYEAKGLNKIIDLGEFWESETGAPIPLGGIVIRRALPDDVQQRVNRVLRRSVEHAFAHRADSLPYVRAHAQEMSEEVMYRHIDLYVNEYSVDLGREGRRAVEILFERATAAGIVPPVTTDLFLSAGPERAGRQS
jgi:1,4-dihydroxy-6-naphthoate synthase